jgi:hypothetical protein
VEQKDALKLALGAPTSSGHHVALSNYTYNIVTGEDLVHKAGL